MLPFKSVIFDLDGVIVNTVPLHFKAWQKMFNDYGYEFKMQDYLKKVDGIPRVDGARAILTDLNDNEIIEAGNKKQAYFVELLSTIPFDKFDSTLDLIKELEKQAIPLAVASSSKNTKAILKKLNLTAYFQAVVTGHDFEKGKPDPEIFFNAAAQLGAKPKESIVFEDAVAGVQAAVNGGFFCVGINRHDHPEIKEIAHITINDASEISLDSMAKAFSNWKAYNAQK
ncbi:HAD family hydrolase [Candidatus Margulisiibacteriota bacterium]